MNSEKQISLAITGASGALYATRLLCVLNKGGYLVHLMLSDAARIVFADELDLKIPANPEKMSEILVERFDLNPSLLRIWTKVNWYSPVASGSSAPSKMVICPCTTGTLSAIAVGASNTLLERAADVVIKEKGTLVLVPREAPFSSIHLENMLKLSNAGVTILPANPGFYHKPQKIEDLVDFIVGRILEHLDVDIKIGPDWGYINNSN